MLETISQIGPLFFPLLALSLLGMALIAERALFFMRLPKLEEAKSFKALNKELDDNKSLSKIIRDELLSFRLIDLQAKLMHGIHFLRIVAVISPMVGLLGTVIGMIKAFKDISEQTGAIAPSMIADGLWSAMLTTAYGLLIALPCLFAAFIFTRLAEKRLEAFQKHLNTKSLKLEGVKLNTAAL
jgi:biopolymer transport protein ExbB